MKYELIELRESEPPIDGNYALIKIGEKNPQYVVVWNLDTTRSMENNDLWDAGTYFPATVEGLQNAIEHFRSRTEYNYIPRQRLKELVTNFKDYIFESNGDEPDVEEITTELKEMYDLSQYECDFFGLEIREEGD